MAPIRPQTWTGRTERPVSTRVRRAPFEMKRASWKSMMIRHGASWYIRDRICMVLIISRHSSHHRRFRRRLQRGRKMASSWRLWWRRWKQRGASWTPCCWSALWIVSRRSSEWYYSFWVNGGFTFNNLYFIRLVNRITILGKSFWFYCLNS